METNFFTGLNLFVYIPTYNRSRALMMQLSALVPQVEKYSGKIRVLVNDNASPDDCYFEHREKFSSPFVEFRRNGANIGGNANIALGFVFAKPQEALWILSDNDIVADDAVEKLLPHLVDDFDLICQRPEINDAVDVIYKWESGWDEPLKSETGRISAVIYNVEKFAAYADMGFYYHNSSFPHLAVILSRAKAVSEIKFRLIQNLYTDREDLRNTLTEYSLSHVGFPLLAELMPPDKAIGFCWGWLMEHWKSFFYYRLYHPCVFRQTIAMLKNKGPQFIDAITRMEAANVPGKPCKDRKWRE